jgi:NADPH:quinone reductase-like Zn-dependent oxidoreductase
VKAVVFTGYGSPDVLELREVPEPVPRENEVLVRVHATSLNDWDVAALDGTSLVNRMMFGLLKPKLAEQILGSDIAGVVEAVGSSATRFRPGDEVYGDLSGRWGGLAEFVCAPEGLLTRKPPSMTFEQAAAIPQAAMLAVQGLRDVARLQPGQTLLINGAGGGAGTFAIQLARVLGAAEITAVDSAAKLDLMRSLGADRVVDYTREDFTKSGRRYDVILDVKTTRSLRDCARALNPNGIFVTMGGEMSRLLAWPWIAMTTKKKKVRLVVLKTNKDLGYVSELFEARKIEPVIDGPYPLSETPEAFRRFAEGRHLGKIVITP